MRKKGIHIWADEEFSKLANDVAQEMDIAKKDATKVIAQDHIRWNKFFGRHKGKR